MLPFLLCYERNRFDEDAKMAPGISRRASSMLRSNRLRAERSGSLPCHFRPWRRDRVSFSNSHPSYLITLSSYSDRHEYYSSTSLVEWKGNKHKEEEMEGFPSIEELRSWADQLEEVQDRLAPYADACRATPAGHGIYSRPLKHH